MNGKNINISLKPLEEEDKEQFIADNQEAFNYGALEEFGIIDDHFEEEGQIIARDTIEKSINEGKAYRIIVDEEKVGGAIIKVDGEHGELLILFVSPKAHSKGIGYASWCEIEKLHPEVKVWEVEFYNEYNPYPDEDENEDQNEYGRNEEMFRFRKIMKKTKSKSE